VGTFHETTTLKGYINYTLRNSR